MKFECQESCGGKCCTFEWGNGASFVFLTKADQERLELSYGLKVRLHIAESIFDFTRFMPGKSQQAHILMTEKGCPFFKEGKCGVYNERPTQCRTFPYWPELLKEKNLEKVKEVCPGIGKGSGEKGVDLMLEQIEADMELRMNVI